MQNSPAYCFSQSTVAHDFYKGKIPAGRLLDYIRTDIHDTFRGEKEEKAHLYGLELFSLALKSDSARGEQLRQERQLRTFICNLWLGKDVSYTLPCAPLRDLEHFYKYHTI